MAVLYKKQKKEKVKAQKNPLTKFSDAVNNRSSAYKLRKVPFIQTRKEGGLIYKYGDGVKKVDTLKRTTKVIPNEKPKTRTDVYTDKDLFDKAYKAEMDSLGFYNKYTNPVNKILYNYPFVPVSKINKKPIGNKVLVDDYTINEDKGTYFIKGKTANYNTLENQNIKPIGYRNVKDVVNDDKYIGSSYPVYKKPVVHNVYKPPLPQPEFIEPIQMPFTSEKEKEPEIKLSPIKQGYMKIGWKFDPKTELEVPVLLTHPKMKVKEGKRIFNKDIPTGTMAIPENWYPDFDRPEKIEKTDPYWRKKYVKTNS